MPVVSSDYLELGAVMLALVSDWDAWVFRRVDSFRFSGDDERVLERRQSMDFRTPSKLQELPESLTEDLGGWPVPVTYVNKWRLKQFSLRDEASSAISLVPRSQSVPIAAGMLIALANQRITRTPFPPKDQAMPPAMQDTLIAIVSADPTQSLRLCWRFVNDCASGGAPGPGGKEWTDLACDEVFMGMAYELARGFLMLALYPGRPGRPGRPEGHRVLKFAYSSYVVPARRDRFLVRSGHNARTLRQWSRDKMDSGAWRTRSDPDHDATGRVMVSSVCTVAREGLLEGGPSVACATVKVTGPRRRSRTVRLRPNSAIALQGLRPGVYRVRVRGRSGFRATLLTESRLTVEAGKTYSVAVQGSRENVSRRDMYAPPLPARPASHVRAMSRGLGWHSKPLTLRVRIGDGGSYHCEFAAPEGMHVTRARLVSDAAVDKSARSRVLDLVLDSTQFAHLYARADKAPPAAGYAYFNLRPRVETIARPAFTTAMVATLVLVFLAITWDPKEGFDQHAPALLVVLLGAPSALAAYFAQAVPSRVTNSMLYGLRLFALAPAVASLLAGAVLLVGENKVDRDPKIEVWWIEGWPQFALYSLALLTLLTAIGLRATARVAEHPPEQRRSDIRQGEGFEQKYSIPTNPEGVERPPPNGSESSSTESKGATDPRTVRETMLERAGGLSPATLRALLGQGWRFPPGWVSYIPPALFFDSAETVPTFFGLDEGDLAAIWTQVRR